MNLLEALLLGLVQGLSEFLPISSSGHLTLVEHFLGFEDLSGMVLFGLFCHLGTLLSIVTLFGKEILKALRSKQTFFALILGTLPLVPLVWIIKPLKSLFDRLDLLGFFFLTTALLLWLGSRFGTLKKEARPLDPLAVGLFQALAILPGISRSGSTISGARLLGWAPEKAVTFSFLLAIPAILGAFLLELKEALSQSVSFELMPLAVAFLVSWAAGVVALKIVIRQTEKKNLLPFAWYCLILGTITLVYFNYG